MRQIGGRKFALAEIMRVIHLLRKYDPAEWGGTESAMQRLFAGLREHGVTSVMYCPAIRQPQPGSGRREEALTSYHSAKQPKADPLHVGFYEGIWIKRFHACLPIWGISPE